MKTLITSREGREILSLDGKPINVRTFNKIMDRAGISPVVITPQKTRLYDRKEIKKISRRLPRNRIMGAGGIVKAMRLG